MVIQATAKTRQYSEQPRNSRYSDAHDTLVSVAADQARLSSGHWQASAISRLSLRLEPRPWGSNTHQTQDTTVWESLVCAAATFAVKFKFIARHPPWQASLIERQVLRWFRQYSDSGWALCQCQCLILVLAPNQRDCRMVTFKFQVLNQECRANGKTNVLLGL